MSQMSPPRSAPPTTPGRIGKVSPISGLAVSALACGLVGILVPLVNLVAIGLGATALVKIKRSEGRVQGMGYGIVGISLGVLGFFVSMMTIFMAMGMMIAVRNTTQAIDPKLKAVHASYSTYAADHGRYPIHAAEILVDDSSSSLHHWVVDGFGISNVNQVTLGNYDFINYDFSPEAAATVSKAIEAADTTTPFYRFGECWFVRLSNATGDPEVVVAWSPRGGSGKRFVLFDDGETRVVDPDEWDEVWESDAKARARLALPVIEPP